MMPSSGRASIRETATPWDAIHATSPRSRARADPAGRRRRRWPRRRWHVRALSSLASLYKRSYGHCSSRDLEVAMPYGHPFPRSMRRELFDLVCSGISVREAERRIGVLVTTGSVWWRQAGGMRLLTGKGALGLADPGDRSRRGGRGHRVSYDERIVIMRGVDRGLSYAQIGALVGRDRTVIRREVRRNRNPDGDYQAGMAHARAAEKARRPRRSNSSTIRCARRSRPGWMTGGALN